MHKRDYAPDLVWGRLTSLLHESDSYWCKLKKTERKKMSKFLWSTFGLKLKYWIFIFWRCIWGCFNSLRAKLGKVPKSQPSGMIVTFNVRVFVRQTLTWNTFKSFSRKCWAVCCRTLFGDYFRKIVWSQKRSHLFVFIGWKQVRTATVEWD